MNHDEYSLINESLIPVPETKNNYGTLTKTMTLGSRRKAKDGEKEVDQKMETLKTKLKTDDESESCVVFSAIGIG